MTSAQPAPPDPRSLQVLAFDIFGTVVDWHGSIVGEVQALYPQVDANALALAWRAGYQPAMQRVRSGELGWTRIDALHRLILDGLLPRFGLASLSEAERQHQARGHGAAMVASRAGAVTGTPTSPTPASRRAMSRWWT